jgi:hypothetical protein
MFLPHIVPDVRADVPQVPALPVPLVVSRNRHPRLDRGSALQVKHGETWFDYCYHDNATDAVRAFERPRYGCVGPECWRVLCHELDLGELEPLAVRQPEPVYS